MSELKNVPEENLVNPYAAPTSIETGHFDDDAALLPAPRPGKVLIKWLTVCVIAAAPSFYFGGGIGGWRTPEILGMVMGILVFVVGYSLIEFLPQVQSALQKKAQHRATRIAYITRIVISVLFPIGIFVDLYCGIFSVFVSSTITGEQGFPRASSTDAPSLRFLYHLLTTLIQGTVLNIILFSYMLIVYGFLRIAGVDNSLRGKKTPSTETTPNRFDSNL